MAQINKPDLYFNTITYTGDGSSSRSLTGVNFQPDFIWGKSRSAVRNHHLFDSVRGGNKLIKSNSTDAETVDPGSGYIGSFDSDGFTAISGSSDNNNFNNNSENYVAWNWLANNTSGSSNTDGSITSTVSANTTSGFSIVTYTGNGTGGATVGHGLGVVPQVVIVRSRSNGGAGWHWRVYHKSLGATKYLGLNENIDARTSSTFWNDTEPTSSVFSLGSDGLVNLNSGTFIAYCFAEKKGFSKFGSYTGNGNADGTFIYTGFKPAMIIIKGTAINTEWILSDNKRSTYNAVQNTLTVNTSDAEGTGTDRFDFFSNGFKLRNTGANFNTSGGTYIYMAFAENPLVGTNNIPATAR